MVLVKKKGKSLFLQTKDEEFNSNLPHPYKLYVIDTGT